MGIGAPRRKRDDKPRENPAKAREANQVAIVLGAIALALLGSLAVGAFRDLDCGWGLSLGAGLPIAAVASFLTLATWFDAASWFDVTEYFWMRFLAFAVIAVLLTLGVHFLLDWPALA